MTCGLPNGRWRIFTSAPSGLTQDEVDLAAVRSLVDERGPGGIALRDPEWISVFSVHARHADRTRVERVFLIGDAAHIHSPAGGQGLNAGIADAHNLAWKMALAWHGHTGEKLLDSYASERGQAAKAVVRQADTQTRIWLLRKGYQVTLRDNALRLASVLRLFDLAYIPWLAGLRTKYETGPAAGRKAAGFTPGELVPLPLRTALDDLRYTLLVSDPGHPDVRVLLHHCRAELGAVVSIRVLGRRRRCVLVLARPDGYVDTVSQEAQQINARLSELFRPVLTANAEFRRTTKAEIMSVIPDSHRDLLERPLFAHLATIRPDGQPQVNPMWFSWNGEHLFFTNTKTRYKYKNVTANPKVAVSINDPEQPYRYLEIRGMVERIDDDSSGEFFLTLADRYGMHFDGPPHDAEHRVVYVLRPTAASHQ